MRRAAVAPEPFASDWLTSRWTLVGSLVLSFVLLASVGWMAWRGQQDFLQHEIREQAIFLLK